MSAAELSGSGIGRSLRDVRRDAVSGKAVAYERTMEANVRGERPSGMDWGFGVWKSSGKRSSVYDHYY